MFKESRSRWAFELADGTHKLVFAYGVVCKNNLHIFAPNFRLIRKRGKHMVKFLLWCILFVLCWPLALLALVLYPIVWLLLLPFRIVGIAVGGVLSLIWSIITLPARILRRI